MADNQLLRDAGDLPPLTYPTRGPTAFPQSSPSGRAGPYIPEAYDRGLDDMVGLEPGMRDLSIRDMTVPAWMINAAGLAPSKNEGNTTLGNFGRKALTMVPGLSPGVEAYNDYRRGDMIGTGKNALLAAAELAAPAILGSLAARTAPGYRGAGYGLKGGDTSIIEAQQATGLGPTIATAPAKFGIRPAQQIMEDAHGASPAVAAYARNGRTPPERGSDPRFDYDGLPLAMETAAARAGNPRSAGEARRQGEVIYGGPREGSGSVGLSKNAHPNESGLFKYGIYKDGKLVGTASGSVNGENAFIGWIGDESMGQAAAHAGPNAIGVSGVKALREAIRQDYPAAKVFSGNRISGARADGPATRMDAKPRQSVRIPAWMMGASVGGGMLAGEQNQLMMDEGQ